MLVLEVSASGHKQSWNSRSDIQYGEISNLTLQSTPHFQKLQYDQRELSLVLHNKLLV